jgi:uncharacterized protein
MEKIFIPQLSKSVNGTENIQFKQFLENLETLTPVEGVIQVKHQGSFLEVKAQAATIMTLTCDRTLVQFNHRLAINVSELIWLSEPVAVAKSLKEQEVDFDDLVESLSPTGYFDPAAWLYEQLCLAIPFQKIAPDAPEPEVVSEKIDTIDKRWAALLSLQVPDC